MKTLAPWFLIALVLLASATAQDLFANPVQPGEDNLLINPLQRGLQIDTCSQATYDIELTNVGPLADAFALTTDNLNDFARFNETVVFLLSGDTTRVQLTFTPPCGLYGPQNINVVGESQSTGIQFFETIQLDIAATDIPLIADGIDRVSID